MKMFDTRGSLMYEDSTSASASSSTNSSRNSSRNSSIYDDTIGDEIFNFSNGSNLAATLTSMRSNVTRLLNLYFQNVSHEDVQQQHQQNFVLTTTATTIPQRISNAITSATKAAKAVNALRVAQLTKSSLSPSSSSSSSLSSSLSSPTNSASTWSAATAIAGTAKTATSAAATAAATSLRNITPDAEVLNGTLHTSTLRIITYPSFREAIRSSENCSTLFANYTRPQEGLFCNWTWDLFLCWPPTPAGALARMRCPTGIHGIDTRKFAERKCELDGRWSPRPNEPYSAVGWTNYTQCFKPELSTLMDQIKDPIIYDIAVRTRTMEIVGLVLSLCALILSLIIFFNFRTLRNNRTKIHKNLFIAMVIQVIIRLTVYLDQAITRGNPQTPSNASSHGIDNTPYLCEASYVLLEYARTAMFMWMFIEGLYLHNVVTVKVFQGRFPHTLYSIIGWGVPVLMTAIWAVVTANKIEVSENEPCWWNYNLTIYYWILEGPRLTVMMVNFVFLMNIIRVLVVKLRQSQASDVEQARKAVRAAIVLLPLLGVTNLLYLMQPLGRSAWVFGVWAYLTYFLSSFQGFFIAMIYCFLNGEVRAALLKSLSVYMSVRGHSDWVPRRASMFSGAYNTAPETEAHAPHDSKRNESPPNKKQRSNGRLSTQLMMHNGGGAGGGNDNMTGIATNINNNGQQIHITTASEDVDGGSHTTRNNNSSWMFTLCFHGQKVLRVPPASSEPPESVVFELSEQ